MELADLTEEVLCEQFGFPPALAKAIMDPFDYAIGLRDGKIIHFSEAKFDIHNPGWIHLDEVQAEGKAQAKGISIPYPLDRGVDVRIADIMWAADAPNGS